jgi:hypothetical protein
MGWRAGRGFELKNKGQIMILSFHLVANFLMISLNHAFFKNLVGTFRPAVGVGGGVSIRPCF